MKFSLKAILWVVALLASAVAAFGELGILLAVLIPWLWITVCKKQSNAIINFLIASGLGGLLVATIIYESPYPHEAHSHDQCRRNLKFIGLELVNRYSNKQRPSLLIWRTAFPEILRTCPYDLYTRGVSNSYFGVLDPRCAWSEDQVLMMSDVKDGANQTILLLEVSKSKDNSKSVNELTFDEAMAALTNTELKDTECHRVDFGFFYKSHVVRHALFADGQVKALTMPLPYELAEALLTVDGGESISENEISEVSQPDIDWAKVYSLCMLVLVSMMPSLHLDKLRGQQVGMSEVLDSTTV